MQKYWLGLWLFLVPICSWSQSASIKKSVAELPLISGFYETGISEDWLLAKESLPAKVFRNSEETRIILSNGLISRTFAIGPAAATVAFDNLLTHASILRGIKPEAEISINGTNYEVGGLKGQPNYAYLEESWIKDLTTNPDALVFTEFQVSPAEAPFTWKKVRHHDSKQQWPPKGIHLRMAYEMPKSADLSLQLSVHYELYDGIPVQAKWITVENKNDESIRIDSFSSEILAVVEYASTVETRNYEIPFPNIHVETDYAFASMEAKDANHHVVHWETDPQYSSQVSYLKRTPCLLRISPELGPNVLLKPGESFQSFRSFVLPFDGYDRERNGLAQRRMYRTLAPWTTENPLMMHARFADWEQVKKAIDQAAEVGFEMVILTFGSGFNIEDSSKAYLAKMKRYADYAKSKGVEIGGYSLLASRKIGKGMDVVMREGETATFGNSPCIGSSWGQAYFHNLYNFYQKTGFTLLEHDGSYPGDYCMSADHPGHEGLADSRWKQYQTISQFYTWCRSQGIYLNIPDYYYMTGGNKCAMGYREVNWSLPRAQQVIHTRQNIFDGTWTKLVSMGWMFVPLTEYHGGGDAATIEPLHDHLDHYENMMVSNLAAGVQACYRGPRLYDTAETQEMVEKQVSWYKKHRNVLEGDLIHLRRADGRDLDYWLMVNPSGKEKAALVVFNPTHKPIQKALKVPLYYAGLTDMTRVQHENEMPKELQLTRDYSLQIEVNLAASAHTVYFFE